MGNRPSHFHRLKKAIDLVAVGHLQGSIGEQYWIIKYLEFLLLNSLAEIDTGFGKRYPVAPNQSSKDPETFLEAAYFQPQGRICPRSNPRSRI